MEQKNEVDATTTEFIKWFMDLTVEGQDAVIALLIANSSPETLENIQLKHNSAIHYMNSLNLKNN